MSQKITTEVKQLENEDQLEKQEFFNLSFNKVILIILYSTFMQT